MQGNNIVFKCNLCDGGKTDRGDFGFKGVCQEDTIKYNIKEKARNWCSQECSLCGQYYKRKFDYNELKKKAENGEFICYESQMLKNWIAYAGSDEKDNKHRLRKILNVNKNQLAVLTVEQRGTSGAERRIFGLFMIDEYESGDGDKVEGYVACNSEYKLSFSYAEANNMKFWDFYRNENSDKCQWGSGLFRYIDDITAAQILKRACEVKKNTADEQLAEKFLNHFCKIHGIKVNEIPAPYGQRIKDKKGYITI